MKKTACHSPRGTPMVCPDALSLAMDSKELSSILDCFGDKKAIKTPKLNTIWLELIARAFSMPIELKGDNYYSKVFKRVNYKLWNNTFWVVINHQLGKIKNFTYKGWRCLECICNEQLRLWMRWIAQGYDVMNNLRMWALNALKSIERGIVVLKAMK